MLLSSINDEITEGSREQQINNIESQLLAALQTNDHTSDLSDLLKSAVGHQRRRNNRRWPTLEKVFIYLSDVILNANNPIKSKPRSIFFTYLDSIVERWPEGDELAHRLFNSSVGKGIIYSLKHGIAKNKAIMSWLVKNGMIDTDVDWRSTDAPEDYYAL